MESRGARGSCNETWTCPHISLSEVRFPDSTVVHFHMSCGAWLTRVRLQNNHVPRLWRVTEEGVPPVQFAEARILKVRAKILGKISSFERAATCVDGVTDKRGAPTCRLIPCICIEVLY